MTPSPPRSVLCCGGFAALAVVLATLALPAPAHPADVRVSERELKAALILRLINFVEWPSRALPRAAFPVCVVGDDPLANALRQTASSLPGSPLPVQVSHHPTTKGLNACRLVVFGQFDERQVRAFLTESTAEPILTVGETDEFLRDGGIVRLRVEKGHVRIDLSLPTASSAGLKVSSRLARLANQGEDRKGVRGQ